MPMRDTFPYGTREERAAVWKLVLSHLGADAFVAAAGTVTLMRAGYSSRLENTLSLAADQVVYAALETAKMLGRNPACVLQESLASLFGGLPRAGLLPLALACESLTVQDPTGEIKTPHGVCLPWPDGSPVCSVSEIGNGSLLGTAVRFAGAGSHVDEDSENLPLSVLMAVPDVLIHVLDVGVGGDRERVVGVVRSLSDLREWPPW